MESGIKHWTHKLKLIGVASIITLTAGLSVAAENRIGPKQSQVGSAPIQLAQHGYWVWHPGWHRHRHYYNWHYHRHHGWHYGWHRGWKRHVGWRHRHWRHHGRHHGHHHGHHHGRHHGHHHR